MIFVGVYEVHALKLYLSPPHQTHYPPSAGDKVYLEVMLDELDAGEYIYNLSFAIDYDADVVKIEDPRFPKTTGFPQHPGDIEHHFNDFSTDPSVQNYNMNTTDTLDPPADSLFDGKNVERYIFGTSVNKTQGGTVSVDEFPFQRPATGLPASLMKITFTIQTDDPTKSTNILFVLGKTEASDRDGNRYDIDTQNADISLPVKLSMFTAVRYPDSTEVIWEVESQIENLGWNLYRSETKDDEFVRINAEVIQGDGTTDISKKYKFVDKDTQKGKSYFYYLECISFEGQTNKSNIIEVSLANTSLSWGAIKSLTLNSRHSAPALKTMKPITRIKVYDRNGNLLRIQQR